MKDQVVLEDGKNLLLARPGSRLGARAIDGIIPTVLILIGLDGLLVSILFVVYEVSLLTLYGQTLGKRLLHVKVVRIDSGGTPSWQQVVIRLVVPSIPAIFLLILGFLFLLAGSLGAALVVFILVYLCEGVLALLIYGTLLSDEHRRGWHDKRASTIVVKADT